MLVSKTLMKTQEKRENSARNVLNARKMQHYALGKSVSLLRFSRVFAGIILLTNLTKTQPQRIVYYGLKDSILVTSPLT